MRLRETDRISMNIMTCVCVLELHRRVPKDSLLYVELECNNTLQNMYKSKSIFVKLYRILFTKLTKISYSFFQMLAHFFFIFLHFFLIFTNLFFILHNLHLYFMNFFQISYFSFQYFDSIFPTSYLFFL